MSALNGTVILSIADTKQAEGQLPDLIRRLVVASNHTVELAVMPYGDSLGRSRLNGFELARSASA